MNTCPVCKLLNTGVEQSISRDTVSVTCPRCGPYVITGTAFALFKHGEPDLKLSAWLRSQEVAADRPVVNSQTGEQVHSGVPAYKVSEKQALFLKAVQDRTKFPGAAVDIIQEYDFPLAWSSSVDELNFIIQALMGRGLLEIDVDQPADAFAVQTRLTPKGWDYLDSLEKAPVLSAQAFIAMSFAADMNNAWSIGIKPAVERAGFRPYRVDADPHIERIDAKIVTEIRNSRFLVADVTQQKPGVYFEAGLAMGLGMPVFWAVRKDELEKVHFDTRQYFHVVWETEDDLAEKLYYLIAAVMGKAK
jgi:hypothetical protein